MKKTLTLLAAVSLGLNLMLLAVILAGRNNDSPAPVAPSAPSAAKPATAAISAETWTQLKTDDLPALIERLRAQGFPPEIIRSMLAAQLRESYAAREKALDPDQDRRPFWKNYSIDPKVQMARSQLYREQQKKLRELLGTEGDQQQNINALYQGRRFDSVPPEKLDEVQRLLTAHEEARSEIFSSMGGGMIGAEAQKRLAALDKEHRASLGRVLTPEEMVEWDVRNSDTARNIRYELSAFNPTETEFREIFRLRSAMDQEFGQQYGMLSQEEMRRRGEAQRLVTEQIKGALGATRATEYERASDHSFRQTSQLVARLELPETTTHQVYDIQKDIRDRMNATMRSTSSQAEREQQLAQLASETESRVTAVLGARGFEAYKQYGGTWMQMLRPRPARPQRP